MCSFARTLWLTIFTYGQTFGVFVWILSDDRPLYLSLVCIYMYTYVLAMYMYIIILYVYVRNYGNTADFNYFK